MNENPFADLVAAVKGTASRFYFVTPEQAQKVLDACPSAEWRLLFALSRYGGLRCPSEHLGLRWADIDLDAGTMLVHSPKTEHHEGGESRLVPIFPELRPYLEDARELADDGAEWVITKTRDTTVNLRTMLQKIIKRAGVGPWPKLWQNLRSTRETELAETFPIHVVCQWIGNSQAVARKHYLQVTDEHFKQAAALQIPVHHGNDSEHFGKIPSNAIAANRPKKPQIVLMDICSVGGTGLEPVTSTV